MIRRVKAAVKLKVTAYGIAEKLAAMDKSDDINEFGPRILELMKNVPFDVWQTLDEKPGLFGYMKDRFYMLRQVRNNPEWGRKMFAGFDMR